MIFCIKRECENSLLECKIGFEKIDIAFEKTITV